MNELEKMLDVQSGVVIVDNEPYYYIDLIQGDDGKLVIAYELGTKGIELYKQTKDPNVLFKKRMLVETKEKPYEGTSLAQHLNNRRKLKVKRKFNYLPAIFTTPVINGTDTVTGNWGLGFPEMHKKVLVGPKTGKYEKMEKTGIFIGLNNVKWLKDTYQFDRWKGYIGPLYSTYMPYFNVLTSSGAM